MNENLMENVVASLDNENDFVNEDDLNIKIDKEDESINSSEATTFEKRELNTKIEKETVDIGVVPFPKWFKDNKGKFKNIKLIKISVSGVDPDKSMIFSIEDPSGGTFEGNEKRELFLFKNAHKYVVLDLLAFNMDIFNNGFKIVYKMEEDLYLKCYGVKTGLIVVYCAKVGEKLIPYYRNKLKKRDKGIRRVTTDVEEIKKLLLLNADLDSLQLLYKQLTKCSHEIKTNQDMINWFYEREKTVTDINHLMQIDDILISLLGMSKKHIN